jgi:hypothetical protein
MARCPPGYTGRAEDSHTPAVAGAANDRRSAAAFASCKICRQVPREVSQRSLL